jgi:hypothetical protein
MESMTISALIVGSYYRNNSLSFKGFILHIISGADILYNLMPIYIKTSRYIAQAKLLISPHGILVW